MSQNILASGWLDKTGGAGHGHKNTRRRWFVLKGLTLLYYADKPSEGKDIDSLKGMVYLPGSKLTVQDRNLSLMSAAKREIILSTPHEADVKSWEAAIQFSLKRAEVFQTFSPVEGPLSKRGGKGHKFQNWKKRHFVLKGNTLLYYEKSVNEAKEVQGLKGWIDLAEITQLVKTEDPQDGCDKPHYIKIVVNNDKEYFLAASSEEEKARWFKAIRKQMRLLSEEFQLIGLNLKDYEETPVRTCVMTRRTSFGLEKIFFVLTTLNIRMYKSEKDYIPADFGKRLIGSIPLLGAAVQETIDNFMAVNDMKGHSHFFTTESPVQNAEWLTQIGDTRAGLIEALVRRNCSISLSTNAFDGKNAPLGFVTTTIRKDGLSVFYLKNSATIDIPLNMIMRIQFNDGTFVLLFDDGNKKEKRIELRSTNSIALFDTISRVISTVATLMKENGGDIPPPSPRKNKSPRHTVAEDTDQIKSVVGNKLEVPKSRKKDGSKKSSTEDSGSSSPRTPKSSSPRE